MAINLKYMNADYFADDYIQTLNPYQKLIHVFLIGSQSYAGIIQINPRNIFNTINSEKNLDEYELFRDSEDKENFAFSDDYSIVTTKQIRSFISKLERDNKLKKLADNYYFFTNHFKNQNFKNQSVLKSSLAKLNEFLEAKPELINVFKQETSYLSQLEEQVISKISILTEKNKKFNLALTLEFTKLYDTLNLTYSPQCEHSVNTVLTQCGHSPITVLTQSEHHYKNININSKSEIVNSKYKVLFTSEDDYRETPAVGGSACATPPAEVSIEEEKKTPPAPVIFPTPEIESKCKAFTKEINATLKSIAKKSKNKLTEELFFAIAIQEYSGDFARLHELIIRFIEDNKRNLKKMTDIEKTILATFTTSKDKNAIMTPKIKENARECGNN